MNTIKYYLRYVLHMILLYVQDFDGLKTKLYLANDSYDSYTHMGEDLKYVGLTNLEGDWIVKDFGKFWHHNPKIVVMQYSRLSYDWNETTVRLSKVII